MILSERLRRAGEHLRGEGRSASLRRFVRMAAENNGNQSDSTMPRIEGNHDALGRFTKRESSQAEAGRTLFLGPAPTS